MQKFRPGNIAKTCLAILGFSLLTQSVFGYENNTLSYLDSMSSSYLYNKPSNSGSLLNMNSIDARAMEATLKLANTPQITNSNIKVNMSLRESDIKQALRMLADKAKVNIVFDKSVDGKITLDLNNISINDAFMAIFKSSRLTYTQDGNCITVMTLTEAQENGYLAQNMTLIPVKYVNALSVATFVNSNLFNSKVYGLSTKPVVTANPRTNQLIVFGTNADVTAIKRLLPLLDTKPVVTTFKVNHTSPKEMANLICDSLFYKSGNDEDTKSEDTDSDDDTKITLGGGVVACRSIIKTEDLSDGGDTASADTQLLIFQEVPLSVTYFNDLGTISITGGSVEQAQVIGDFIKQNDKKQLMAYVELSVIELNETGSKEFTNEWNLWTPFISLGFSPSNGLSTSQVSPFFVWGDNFPTQKTVESKDSSTGKVSTETETTVVQKTNNRALTYTLKYLVQTGNGRVLTNPKIMVTNGRKATIDMTSDYVKSVTSQILQGSDTITSATQRTYDIGSDEGLKIDILPFISPDGYVSMNISPEFATIKQQIYAANSAGTQELAATLLQRRDLELKNIRIKDGETLVLAGLIKESEQQTVQKMPILSDLPFIGVFFRGNSNNKAREELVIVVTPHIIKDGTEASGNDMIYDL